jgi:hypothetical protein
MRHTIARHIPRLDARSRAKSKFDHAPHEIRIQLRSDCRRQVHAFAIDTDVISPQTIVTFCMLRVAIVSERYGAGKRRRSRVE